MTRYAYNRRAVPDQPTGAPLNVRLEIVVPEATINLFLNPSWERDTSNWTNSSDGSSGTPYQRSTTRQFKGAYSAQLTIRPTSGTFGQIVNASVSNATQYAMSFFVRRANGGIIRSANCKAFINGAVTDWDSIVYVAGGWYRVEKVWTSTSTAGVGIRVIGSPSAIFYVDAAQLETKGYCTTYCDGDQVGLLPVDLPAAYYWTGTPHASTSVRSATTRAGGRPMNVARFGLTILALIGMGLPQRSVIDTPLGLADGSLYQRTIRESRDFTIAGVFEASDPRTLSARRGALRSLLSYDLNGVDQPLVMRLQRYDQAEVMGDQVVFAASYLEGLGEDMAQPFDEQVSVQFRQFLPALMSAADRGTTLGVQTSVSNANAIIQRNANGSYAALSTGISGASAVVTDLIIGPDGLVYATGSFTTAGGVAASHIARWNGSSWAALSSGLTGLSGNALAIGPDGSLYVGGSFTSASGVANTLNIARWNGSTWNALGVGGAPGGVSALAVGPDGSLYAGGSFTTIGGVAANRVARWNGTAWSALGTGMDSSVFALAVGPDGSLYAGGSFTTAGGTSAIGIARWNGSAWSAVGVNSTAATILALAFDQAGNLYAGGSYTDIGGISANRIARWNGSAWSALGAGVSGGVDFILPLPGGGLYVGGDFDFAGGLTLPDRVALWTGSAWAPLDADLPSTASPSTAVRQADGSFIFGFDTSGSATVASVTSVTNPGTVPAGFTLAITGPSSGSSRVYNLFNNTTGKAIYFDLAILSGETVYLAVGNGTYSLRSSFRGNITSAILPASDSDFTLIKGANSLSFFAASSTVTATLAFTPQYESLDDATLTVAIQ